MSLRQRNKQKVRQNILAAAGTLIASQGVERTTTREIAANAEVSYQTLYNYFPSKSQIVRGLLDDDFATWSDSVAQIVKHYDGDLIESLVRIDELVVEMISSDSERFELWRNLARSFLFDMSGDGSDHLAGITNAVQDQIVELLHLAQGMKQLPETLDVQLMCRTLFCLSDYGVLLYLIHGIDEETFIQTQREQITLLVKPYILSV